MEKLRLLKDNKPALEILKEAKRGFENIKGEIVNKSLILEGNIIRPSKSSPEIYKEVLKCNACGEEVEVFPLDKKVLKCPKCGSVDFYSHNMEIRDFQTFILITENKENIYREVKTRIQDELILELKDKEKAKLLGFLQTEKVAGHIKYLFNVLDIIDEVEE